MAKLFPNKLSGEVTAEVARIFIRLKKLPDSFSIWYSLSNSVSNPHFLVIWEDRCAYLLHITSTSQKLIYTAIHGDLFNGEETISAESLGEQERQILDNFTRNLPNPESFPIKPIVMFPNVNNGTIDTLSEQISQDSGIHFLGKQQLTTDKIAQFFIDHAPAQITSPQLIELRHHFNPEVTVPTRFSPLSINRSNPNATLTPQLLDLDQEWCMKNNLYLSDEAQKTLTDLPQDETLDSAKNQDLNTTTSQLVTGVAGSGKSLVLLYRALLNAQLNPSASVLILTHNRPINNELQARFQHLSDKKYKVTWMTFFQWARQQLSQEEWSPDKAKERVLYPEESLALLENIVRDDEKNTFNSSFLLDEIGFIKDHRVHQLSEYLTISRSGQGRGLKESQRKSIWSIYKKYQNHLKDNRLTDWHNIAIRFHKKAMSGKCSFPSYHCILIDEAQFFAKTWFDVVKKALIPGGQLFLSADPTQGFLKRRQSWISSGIEVRGRTTKLAKAYRNSKEILDFSTKFYRNRQTSNEPSEGLNLLSSEQINEAKSTGLEPTLIPTQSDQDTLTRLLNELDQFSQAHSKPETAPSLLILHADSKKLYSLQQSLSNKLAHLHFHDTKSGPAPAHTFAQFSTLNAATGLESSIVFLLGIDTLLDKESSPQLDQEERDELITQNTRQLYMAFTRAAQKLIVFTNYQLP